MPRELLEVKKEFVDEAINGEVKKLEELFQELQEHGCGIFFSCENILLSENPPLFNVINAINQPGLSEEKKSSLLKCIVWFANHSMADSNLLVGALNTAVKALEAASGINSVVMFEAVTSIWPYVQDGQEEKYILYTHINEFKQKCDERTVFRLLPWLDSRVITTLAHSADPMVKSFNGLPLYVAALICPSVEDKTIQLIANGILESEAAKDTEGLKHIVEICHTSSEIAKVSKVLRGARSEMFFDEGEVPPSTQCFDAFIQTLKPVLNELILGDIAFSVTVDESGMLHSQTFFNIALSNSNSIESPCWNIVQWLIENGCDVNQRTIENAVALGFAAQQGHMAMLRYLINKHADVNAFNKYKVTPLSYAAGGGHVECVDLLLANGADPNLVDINGTPALILASWEGHGKVVEILLRDPRTNVCKQNKEGMNALMSAILERGKNTPDHEQCALLLLEHSDLGQITTKFHTVAHLASQKCSPTESTWMSLLEKLAAKDPSIFMTEYRDGDTPLRVLFEKGMFEWCKQHLDSLLCDPVSVSSISKETALIIAMRFFPIAAKSYVRYCIEKNGIALLSPQNTMGFNGLIRIICHALMPEIIVNQLPEERERQLLYSNLFLEVLKLPHVESILTQLDRDGSNIAHVACESYIASTKTIAWPALHALLNKAPDLFFRSGYRDISAAEILIVHDFYAALEIAKCVGLERFGVADRRGRTLFNLIEDLYDKFYHITPFRKALEDIYGEGGVTFSLKKSTAQEILKCTPSLCMSTQKSFLEICGKDKGWYSINAEELPWLYSIIRDLKFPSRPGEITTSRISDPTLLEYLSEHHDQSTLLALLDAKRKAILSSDTMRICYPKYYCPETTDIFDTNSFEEENTPVGIINFVAMLLWRHHPHFTLCEPWFDLLSYAIDCVLVTKPIEQDASSSSSSSFRSGKGTVDSSAKMSGVLSEYSMSAIDDLLQLRLPSYQSSIHQSIEFDGIHLIFSNTGNKLFSGLNSTLAVPILITREDEDNHWVGVVIKFSESSIGSFTQVMYIDPENNPMPINLQMALFEVVPGYIVEFVQVNVPTQCASNTCGPELVEDIAAVLTGTRADSSQAVALHSMLFEQHLICKAINVEFSGLANSLSKELSSGWNPKFWVHELLDKTNALINLLVDTGQSIVLIFQALEFADALIDTLNPALQVWPLLPPIYNPENDSYPSFKYCTGYNPERQESPKFLPGNGSRFAEMFEEKESI